MNIVFFLTNIYLALRRYILQKLNNFSPLKLKKKHNELHNSRSINIVLPILVGFQMILYFMLRYLTFIYTWIFIKL